MGNESVNIAKLLREVVTPALEQVVAEINTNEASEGYSARLGNQGPKLDHRRPIRDARSVTVYFNGRIITTFSIFWPDSNILMAGDLSTIGFETLDLENLTMKVVKEKAKAELGVK